ncbi:RluA family pseudouridine synthase [Aquabacterium sp.]|uniref:pseudouridine synthase n=1 Tax=Aquabacterium sp. TaxID=1872578 RepID=UPI002487E86D|nr:RluA family pseudouridine synthase [Aquabacterium sp.]MDI1258340.1 RluA family pseudouridine synthase [Aquabacterium sp.]
MTEPLEAGSAALHQLADYAPPPHTGLDIAYADDTFLIVNKPSGLLSVPGRGEKFHDSLASRVLLAFPQALIVHRLDMQTSGLLVMALGAQVHRDLSALFQTRQVQKRYVAQVAGQMATDIGEVALPLITDWPNRPRQKVDWADGKPALTRWQVVARDALHNTTRVELEPVTGRSHQLRVHMMSIGHAIVGDPLYASAAVRAQAGRLLLHAAELKLQHPRTGEWVHTVSPVPF